MNKSQALKKILFYVFKYWYLVVLSLVVALTTVVMNLMIPILSGNAIDCMVAKGQVDFDNLYTVLQSLAAVIAVNMVAGYLLGIINNRLTFSVARDIRNDAIAVIEHLPLAYLDTASTGDMVSRVISDVDQFTDGLLLGFSQLFTGILTIAGTLIFMFRQSVTITLVVILVTPVSLFAATFISKKSYKYYSKQATVRGEQTAYIDEMIGNQKVVKSFAFEDEAEEHFNQINDEYEKCSRKAVFYSSLTNPVTRFVNSLVYGSVVLFGSLAVIGGSFTIGSLSCFLNYAGQYTKPFNEISGVLAEFQNALACAVRIFELIYAKRENPDDKDAVVLEETTLKGEVEIKNVYFSYVENKPLIEDFSLKIKPGQRVAIVGPTGCGKTTLINLLMRFYDVNRGEIFIDGTDIRNITRDSLRRNFGMVLQETYLFAGSIRENICMGKSDATDQEMIAAAKAAHCHGFIKRLPNGYDTVLGEDGGDLSQGQKQLLCIARVMLCLPPMLILDEATSSIDTRTELKVQDAFSKLMKGRTSFIVAHRLSTIKNADIIIVMKDGHIIEQGNHDELIAAGGFYNNLYMSQFAK